MSQSDVKVISGEGQSALHNKEEPPAVLLTATGKRSRSCGDSADGSATTQARCISAVTASASFIAKLCAGPQSQLIQSRKHAHCNLLGLPCHAGGGSSASGLPSGRRGVSSALAAATGAVPLIASLRKTEAGGLPDKVLHAPQAEAWICAEQHLVDRGHCGPSGARALLGEAPCPLFLG